MSKTKEKAEVINEYGENLKDTKTKESNDLIEYKKKIAEKIRSVGFILSDDPDALLNDIELFAKDHDELRAKYDKCIVALNLFVNVITKLSNELEVNVFDIQSKQELDKILDAVQSLKKDKSKLQIENGNYFVEIVDLRGLLNTEERLRKETEKELYDLRLKFIESAVKLISKLS